MTLPVAFISLVLLAISGTQAQDGLVTELPTDGIMLSCTESQMIVEIPKELLTGGMSGSDLKFEKAQSNQEECWGADGVNSIVLTTNLTDCGTVRNENNDEETYSNRIVNKYADNVISRQYSVEIPLECIYNRSSRVDLIQYKLTDYIVDKEMSDSGKYSFNFDIYEDDNYHDKYPSYPVVISLNQPLYFAASVLSLRQTLELSIRSCRATPSSNYYDSPHYDFINNACSDDPTTNITYFDDEAHRVGVEINTFRFIAEGDFVYLHCNLLVCDAKDADSICKLKCADDQSQSGRRRRDVISASSSLTFQRLTRGPIRVIRSANRNSISRMDDTENDSPQQQVSSAFNPWMVAMVAMATIVMALAALMVVVLRQVNKMASVRRKCLREESVHLLAAEEE